MLESRRHSALLALALFLALGACAASGDNFAPLATEGGKGAIYVYTLDDNYDLQPAPKVVVDGQPAGRLKPRGHLRFPVEPGKHSVRIDSSIYLIPIKDGVEVEVKPGGSAYVRIDAFRVKKLIVMPADLAQDELKATRGNN
jgi:hypothetical protein